MIASLDPANGSPSWNDESLARTLRLDLEDEERRALLGSYAISSAIGIAFLLLQQFGPRSEPVINLRPAPGPEITVGDLSSPPPPTIIPRLMDRIAGGGGRRVAAGAGGGSVANAIVGAFDARSAAGGGLVGDTRGLLRDVAVTNSTGDAGAGTDAKGVLAYGEGGMGSTVRGGSGLGGGNASGIGGVVGNAGVGRAAVVVTGPEVRALDLPRDGMGSTLALGTFVRGREPELRFCYQESLKANPALAGSVSMALTIAAGGTISNAVVARRSWRGTGVAEAEACMLRSIRNWRFSGSERPGTYTFQFSFTR